MAGKKILIVEDDNSQLTGRARQLKTAGYEVVGARDGTSAVSTARKELPDLILLDLGLPAGDGFVVMQRLRNIIPTSTIPVVVLSSREAREARNEALNAGAVAYAQKPVDTQVLLKTIREVLGEEEAKTA